MIGDTLYVFSQYYPVDVKTDDNLIHGYQVDNGEYQVVKSNDICIMQEVEIPIYTVVSAMNINNFGDVNTKAVLGANGDFYAGLNNFYFTHRNFGKGKTQIIKIAVDETEMKIKNTATVDGVMWNELFMNEYNGEFRILTVTGYDTPINQLYMFDEKMKNIGSLENIALGETIASVRFQEDMVNILTDRDENPLFVIDLSDAATPAIKKEIGMPKHLRCFYYVNDDLMIGVGTSVEEKTNTVDGMKVSLFDVSDIENPKELNSLVFKDITSEAVYNYRVFNINEKDGYFLLPFGTYSGDVKSLSGTMVLMVKDNKLIVDKKLENSYVNLSVFPNRNAYINDVIYVFAPDTITAYDSSDYKLLGEVKLEI